MPKQNKHKRMYNSHDLSAEHRIEVMNPLFSGFISKEGVSLRVTAHKVNPEDLYLLSEFVQNNVTEDKQDDILESLAKHFGAKLVTKDDRKTFEVKNV